ncbi:cytochrome c-type biogenesis CcmF C-terminal domain-containing protein, partial [Photobacterium sanguinicancri]
MRSAIGSASDSISRSHTSGQSWRRMRRSRRLRIPRAILGMSLAHAGVGVFVIGITLVSVFGAENIVRMEAGDTASVSGYNFTFHG